MNMVEVMAMVAQTSRKSGGEELEAGRRLAEQRLAKEQGSSLISY